MKAHGCSYMSPQKRNGSIAPFKSQRHFLLNEISWNLVPKQQQFQVQPVLPNNNVSASQILNDPLKIRWNKIYSYRSTSDLKAKKNNQRAEVHKPSNSLSLLKFIVCFGGVTVATWSWERRGEFRCFKEFQTFLSMLTKIQSKRAT